MSSTAEAVEATALHKVTRHDVERAVRDLHNLKCQIVEAMERVAELDGQIEHTRREVLRLHKEHTNHCEPVGTYRVTGQYSYNTVLGAAVVDAMPDRQSVTFHIFNEE